jgi:phytoene dehydrogenase-like protein
MTPTSEVVIVGAGLAGLYCAGRLWGRGIACRILEASDDVGGRVRTDHVDGFLLDRGFQVLLTAYPESQRVLDYTALDLRPFYPGALVRFNGRFHRVADPWRRPIGALANVFSPVGTLQDKLTVAGFRRRVRAGSVEELLQRPEITTYAALRNAGFSDVMIERFFRPFFGGVFLDRELRTTSRMLDFVFRMFSLGDIAVPARGMGAIAQQLAGGLPPRTIRTQTRVKGVQDGTLVLDSNEQLRPRAVVIATDGASAAQLLGEQHPPPSQQVTCLYFAVPRAPLKEPVLVLNGEGHGIVNSLCVISAVAPTYASPGAALLSVTVLGIPVFNDQELETAVRSHLATWFGQDVHHQWRHLRTYRIPYALPQQYPPSLVGGDHIRRVRAGLFVCGDQYGTASINGAMASGRYAADAVLAELGRST